MIHASRNEVIHVEFFYYGRISPLHRKNRKSLNRDQSDTAWSHNSGKLCEPSELIFFTKVSEYRNAYNQLKLVFSERSRGIHGYMPKMTVTCTDITIAPIDVILIDIGTPCVRIKSQQVIS